MRLISVHHAALRNPWPATLSTTYRHSMPSCTKMPRTSLTSSIPAFPRFVASACWNGAGLTVLSQLVHYADAAKCTLMANGPPGDVEVLLPGDDDLSSGRREAIRLRLHRGKRTLEVSRHVSKAGTSKDVGEWTKKVVLLSNLLDFSGEDLLALDGSERTALACLGDFLRICDVAEGVEIDSRDPGGENLGLGENGRARLERVLRHWENKSEDVVPDVRRPPSQSRSGASGVSSMVVPPRPRKFSAATMLR